MAQQVQDIDTVGFNDPTMSKFFDFYVNNTFYLLAPDYYRSFYSIYLNRCLSCYDGWVGNFHNAKEGLVPQRMLQSIARGLNNMLFAHGIDFSGDSANYQFAVDWAKRTKFYRALKKAHLFSVAGGTSLMKINREGRELFVTAHRIDTFFVDVDATGKVVSAKVYFDSVHATNAQNGEKHFGICEERYFDENGRPMCMASVYCAGSSLQTESLSRPKNPVEKVNWTALPHEVKQYIKKNYPSIMIDAPIPLPFYKSLGCYLCRFTDDIPQIPNLPFGQPIGDILFSENFQYDQMKHFEKNEVYLARARALVPEEMWNQDDPDAGNRAMSEMFYQKVSSLNSDDDKITPIQFMLRGGDIKTQKENIYKDCAFKLNVSASSIASFLSEGEGERTATSIVSERTKSDTWIDGQINLNKPEIDQMMREIMYYYGKDSVEIVFKCEDQSPILDTVKVWGDQFSAGNISPSMFVKKVHKNLTEKEQQEEIRELTEEKRLRQAQMKAFSNIS